MVPLVWFIHLKFLRLCSQTVADLSIRFAVRVQWLCVPHCWFEPGHGLTLVAFGWSWLSFDSSSKWTQGQSEILETHSDKCFLVCYRFESWGARVGSVSISCWRSKFPNDKQLRKNSVPQHVMLYIRYSILKTSVPSPTSFSFWQHWKAAATKSPAGSGTSCIFGLVAECSCDACFSYEHRHCFNSIRVPLFNQLSCKKTGTATVVGSGASSSPHVQRESISYMRLNAVAISQLQGNTWRTWISSTEKCSRILVRLSASSIDAGGSTHFSLINLPIKIG